MSDVGPLQLLVLQPTPYCNLDCSYCYLPHRNDKTRMSPDILKAIGRMLQSPIVDHDALTVVWHGGEPMTLRPQWYEDAFALLETAAGRPLRHAFQTNAVGVNAAWLALWRKWNVAIGVSLDGPATYHDLNRKTRGGGGSQALTMAGIDTLRAGDQKFHIISVLTAASLADPDGMFDFYVANGLHDLAFNVEEQEGAHATTSLAQGETPAIYHQFLTRFQARMAAHPAPIHCREVDAVRGLIKSPPSARGTNAQVTPLQIVSIGADGAMSTFSPEFLGVTAPAFDNFAFGNVQDGGLETMLDHPAFQALYRDILAGQRACAANCGYFDVCGGGAPANKYFELGTCRGTETLYCRLTCMTALEAVLEHMESATHDVA